MGAVLAAADNPTEGRGSVERASDCRFRRCWVYRGSFGGSYQSLVALPASGRVAIDGAAELPIRSYQLPAARLTTVGVLTPSGRSSPTAVICGNGSRDQMQPLHSGSASQFRANLFVELFLLVKTYSRRLN